MPAQYEAIKKKFLDKGMGEKEAKKHASMIYNHLHPGKPLITWMKEHGETKKGKKS